MAGMEEQLRGLHARSVELETQLQVEKRAKGNLEEANKELQVENNNMYSSNVELKAKKASRPRLNLGQSVRPAVMD